MVFFLFSREKRKKQRKKRRHGKYFAVKLIFLTLFFGGSIFFLLGLFFLFSREKRKKQRKKRRLTQFLHQKRKFSFLFPGEWNSPNSAFLSLGSSLSFREKKEKNTEISLKNTAFRSGMQPRRRWGDGSVPWYPVPESSRSRRFRSRSPR